MHPRLLHIYGPLWIQSYGAMIALGFAILTFLTYHHPLRKRLMSTDQYYNTLFIGLASGIIGGRLLHVITSPAEFAGRWVEAFYPWIPGLFVLGAIIGAIIGISSYLYYQKIPILPILDLTALYTPLMHGISRFGCLAAGCCYGAPAASLPWAITFTNPDSIAPLNIPLHPTQIYMSLASFTIFIILLCCWPTLSKKTGAIAMLFLTLENISRFINDFWRSDRHLAALIPGHDNILLSDAQWMAIPVGLVSAMLLIFLLCKKPSNVASS